MTEAKWEERVRVECTICGWRGTRKTFNLWPDARVIPCARWWKHPLPTTEEEASEFERQVTSPETLKVIKRTPIVGTRPEGAGE